MSGFRRVVIAFSILLLGMAFVPYLGLSSGRFDWQHYANVYQPQLSVNYADGSPGSFFNLTGTGYPPDSQATIWINGQSVGNLRTDSAGRFVFTLMTTAISELGAYAVLVEVNPEASAGFRLRSDAPLRAREGTNQLVAVPPDSAMTDFVYLPALSKP